MSKKVTIKDVAEVAGVCKATVSYVLNNREDQSISEATKKKVWQVVNMLNYRPNSFAQNMRASQEKRIVAIVFPQNPTLLEKLSYFDFLETAITVFRENNYEILLLNDNAERINTADAIVAYGLTREEFFALGDCNLIPLISIDCPINDSLFFEVSYDYQHLKELADAYFAGKAYSYVELTPRDKNMALSIQEVFSDVIFIDRLSDIKALSTKNILVIKNTLQEVISETLDCSVFNPFQSSLNKADQVVRCIKLALEHKPCSQHIFKI